MGNFILTRLEFSAIVEKLEDKYLAQEIKENRQEYDIIENEVFYFSDKDQYLNILKTKVQEYSKIQQKSKGIIERLQFLNSNNINDIEKEKLRSDFVTILGNIVEKQNDFESKGLVLEGIKEIENLKAEIKEHDRNMLNIMGILLAIFSLVGINMGIFGAINEKTTINEIITLILVVNVSLVFSMGALFTYIDHIFNRYEKKK
jgi:ABC-type dipeptide/oligopeptide/nickel transport system permease component